MTTNQGADTRPRLSRTFRVELESGKRMVYIADGYISYEEAGRRIRAKFRCGGRFIK